MLNNDFDYFDALLFTQELQSVAIRVKEFRQKSSSLQGFTSRPREEVNSKWSIFPLIVTPPPGVNFTNLMAQSANAQEVILWRQQAPFSFTYKIMPNQKIRQASTLYALPFTPMSSALTYWCKSCQQNVDEIDPRRRQPSGEARNPLLAFDRITTLPRKIK